MMRSSNPFLKNNSFALPTTQPHERMSLEGVANRTGMLLIVVLFFAAMTWMITWGEIEANYDAVNSGLEPTAGGWTMLFLVVGGVASLIVALIIWFKRPENPQMLMFTYAAFEGMLLGSFSAIAELMVPGVAIQAVGLTFGIFLTMLGIYRMGLIHPSKNFYIAISSAMGAIFLIYFVSFVLWMVPGAPQVPFIHGSGWIGIGFSLFVIVIAALSFVMDFDFIEKGVENGAPKKMEWWAAFGLLVTLVWLYVEIIRLLLKLAARK